MIRERETVDRRTSPASHPERRQARKHRFPYRDLVVPPCKLRDQSSTNDFDTDWTDKNKTNKTTTNKAFFMVLSVSSVSSVQSVSKALPLYLRNCLAWRAILSARCASG